MFSNVIFSLCDFFRTNMLGSIDLWFSVKMMVQPCSIIIEHRLITITRLPEMRMRRDKKTLLQRSKMRSISAQRMRPPILELIIKGFSIEGSTRPCPLTEDQFNTIISN